MRRRKNFFGFNFELEIRKAFLLGITWDYCFNLLTISLFIGPFIIDIGTILIKTIKDKQ